MPNLLSTRSRARRRSVVVGVGGVGGGEDEGAVSRRVCYGIAACAVMLLLSCALGASVSVWLGLAFGALALAALVLAACVAPQSWLVGTSGGGGGDEERVAAAAAWAGRRRFGMPEAAINALPTFAYELRGDGGAGEVELEAGAPGGEPCSVCLEDVQPGEMVRQLPACSHLFHVGCVDMWLHTHRTCPVCLCNLVSPPPRVPGKAAAAAAPAEAEPPPAGDALPPV
ncbi:hypothetical protein ACP4OV_009192 [Aristida adscensionis]